MRRACWCLMIVLAARSASAQTTRPAEGNDALSQSWAGLINDLSKALTESDAEALVPLLSDNVVIQSMDSRNGDAVRLLARTRKGVKLFGRGYPQTPEGLAAELSTAVKNAEIPEEFKKHLTPADEGQTKRANHIATRWILDTIGPKEGEWVGVIVFWCERMSGSEAGGEMVFVLVKGAVSGEGLRIRSIAFGDPRRQSR